MITEDKYKALVEENNQLKATVINKNKLIDKLLDVCIDLTSQTEFSSLMEGIVVGTKDFSHADACTIYLMSEDKTRLEFSVVRTDKLNIRMGGTAEAIAWPPLQLYNEDNTPNNSMVAVKCALEGKLFNFNDVYEVDEFNFEGAKAFDKSTTYRTKSMIVVPMFNTDREVIGVIQLINKLNSSGNIISFNKDDEILLSSMSSLGGVSVHNHKLLDNLQELLGTLEQKVESRTLDLLEAKKDIEAIHKHTRESIEYAALIQSSLVPSNNIFRQYFQEYFVLWHPKDTVGGDIYLFNEISEDECLIFCIDCTGHGVPGAFVTMLVKSVETQIMAEIKHNPNMMISTAWIMKYYNQALKKLLKQEDLNGVSNVGWDGSIFYYNKKTKTIKFSGAESPFFYRKPDGEIVTVKGTRKSVGYKQVPMDFEYKETVIENVESGTKVFLTTDGYLDQNGGPKDFPFGKKKFLKIIEDYGEESISDLQEMFLYEMAEWEEQIEGNDRNDDMTVIGFTI